MSRQVLPRFCMSQCLLLLGWVLANAAMAGDNPEQLIARWPQGSIKSVQDADSALQGVEQARSQIQARHAQQEAACYPKFMVSPCLEQALEAKRNALASVRAIEVEASRFKRAAKLEEHDQALAKKREDDANNAPQRLIKEQDFLKAQAEKEASLAKAAEEQANSDAKAAAKAQQSEQRIKEHEDKLQREASRQARDAAKRRANVEAYEKKQQSAKKRQAELEQKQAEKEKQALQKAKAGSESSSAESPSQK